MNSIGNPEQFADVRKHLPFFANHEGLARLLEGLLCYPEIRKAFADSAHEENPFRGVARRLGLGIRVEGLVELIPKSGPLIVVANHGFGGADALALLAVMCDLRPGFRVLANREVTLLEGVSPHVFPVTLLNPTSARENVSSLRATLQHVRKGGALGVFPAGRVALWKEDRMAEPVWNEHVVKLLQRMDATIVPLWFYGNPPAAINLLSRFSRLVRTALIPTGLAKMRGREIVARAGAPIASGSLRELGEKGGPWLRKKLESLSDLGN
ncbi:MAG: putative hemolysin [Akkermansiaceae bacterium]|jgi:putative hemolysin